ncbi:uncharacterized protein [Trachinotus anak]|uniref:uncharacterized protein isoform X3 n=1 Tax=Trachinotus anak TaxID=443729 RepID=UPI0039F1AF49
MLTSFVHCQNIMSSLVYTSKLGFPVGVRSGDEAFFMSSHQDAAQQRPRILMNHNHNKSFENFWCEDEDTFRECAPSEGQASFNSLQNEDTFMDWSLSEGQASFNSLQNEDTFMDWSLSEGQASNVAPPDSSADEEDPMEVDQQDLCFSSLSLSLSSFCRYLCLWSSRIQIHHYSSLLLTTVIIIDNTITYTAVPGLSLSLFLLSPPPPPLFYLLLNPTGRGRRPPTLSPVLLEVSSC